MKNILVTGGAGYIGSHIVELLIKKGADINLGNRIFNYKTYDIANIFGFNEIKNIFNKNKV